MRCVVALTKNAPSVLVGAREAFCLFGLVIPIVLAGGR